MSRLTVLHHHWLLNSSRDGRILYPATILVKEVFKSYITNVFTETTVEHQWVITRSFRALPTILEELCLA